MNGSKYAHYKDQVLSPYQTDRKPWLESRLSLKIKFCQPFKKLVKMLMNIIKGIDSLIDNGNASTVTHRATRGRLAAIFFFLFKPITESWPDIMRFQDTIPSWSLTLSICQLSCLVLDVLYYRYLDIYVFFALIYY